MTKEYIETLKNELDTQEKFADALYKELGDIMSRSLNGHVHDEDIPRAMEIDDLLVAKKAWIAKAKAEIGAFYKPATVAG